jgi:hypothetical protein
MADAAQLQRRTSTAADRHAAAKQPDGALVTDAFSHASRLRITRRVQRLVGDSFASYCFSCLVGLLTPIDIDRFSNPLNAIVENAPAGSAAAAAPNDIVQRLHAVLRPFLLRRLKVYIHTLLFVIDS